MQDMHIDRIKDWIKRLRDKSEAMAPVLGALEPLLVTQARMRTALQAAGVEPLQTDKGRAAQGKPLMADRPMGEYAEAFLAVSRTILPAMAEAFPAVSDELGKVLYHLEAAHLDPAPTMEARIAGDDDALAAIAKAADVDADVLWLAAEQCLRPILQVAGVHAADDLSLGLWGRPYCPTCGAPPNIAILRKGGEDNDFLTNHGGQRWLHCSRCAAQWRFKRHACPHCGNEESESLEYYQPKDNNGERADVCRACGHYLVAVDVRELVEEPEPDVAALGLIPLDMVMQNEGLAPLAPTAWNRFNS